MGKEPVDKYVPVTILPPPYPMKSVGVFGDGTLFEEPILGYAVTAVVKVADLADGEANPFVWGDALILGSDADGTVECLSLGHQHIGMCAQGKSPWTALVEELRDWANYRKDEYPEASAAILKKLEDMG